MEVPVIVGEDPIVRKVAKLAERLASTSHPIFIAGESGSGREHVARFLHARGPRAVAPFSKFDCGAAVRGACISKISCRFAEARGGSLLIQNCDALSTEDCVALADLAADHRHSVRVVLTASPGDSEVAGGAPAVADRLHALPLYLPPLRFRRADIPALVHHFAESWRREREADAFSFSGAAMVGLWRYGWPGNIRELRTEVRAALQHSENGEVDATHLPSRMFPGPRRAETQAGGGAGARIPLRGHASVSLLC